MMADGQPRAHRHGVQGTSHRPPPPPVPTSFAVPTTVSRTAVSSASRVSRPPAPSPDQLDTGLFDSTGQDREEGYDFDFSPLPDSKYECPICLLVLRDTVQTTCGHRFCTACIRRWLRDTGGPKCPVCNEPITEAEMFADRFADREILLFSMRCPNNKFGCTAMLDLKQLTDHLSQVCEYVLVPCPNHCTSVLYKKDVAWHCAKECIKRQTTCKQCGQNVPTLEKDSHREVCLEEQLSCKFCQALVQRKSVLQHEENCDMKPKHCMFRALGCTSDLTRSEISAHNQVNTQYHLELTARALSRLFQQLNITCQPVDNRLQLTSKDTTVTTGIVLGTSTRDKTGYKPPAPEPGYKPPAPDPNTDQFTKTRQRIPSEGECLISQPAEESVTPQPTTVCTSPPPDGATILQPSYVNLHLSDPGRFKTVTSSSLHLGGGDVSVTSATGPPSKNPALRQQISVEESLRFGAEGGVDFLEKTRQQDASVAKQKQLILELQAKVASLEKRLGESTSSVRALQERARKQDEAITAFEGRNCNGVYVWKIREFTRLRREALVGQTTVLHSPGFYTAFHGYKLCIRANLNGVDKGNSSHISVFIHFMRGEWDEILTWPFRGKIVLTIMDQGEHKQHITEVLESKSHLAAFQQPLTNRNHKGFGYIEFAPVTLIEQSTYIINDTLIVKAEVTEF